MARWEPFVNGRLARTGYDLGPPFMYFLVQQGWVESSVWTAFKSSDPANESFAELGYYTPEFTKSGGEPEWIPLQDDLFWGVTSAGFAFGSFSDSFRIPHHPDNEYAKDGEAYAIFDTNSAYIDLPSDLFKDVTTTLQYFYRDSGVVFNEASGTVEKPCDVDGPDLYIMLGDLYVDLNLGNTFSEVVASEDPETAWCVSSVLRNAGDKPFITLGEPVYEDLYVVHDDTQGRIGLAANYASPKDGPVRAEKPVREFKEIHDTIYAENNPPEAPAERQEDEFRWFTFNYWKWAKPRLDSVEDDGARIVWTMLWGVSALYVWSFQLFWFFFRFSLYLTYLFFVFIFGLAFGGDETAQVSYAQAGHGTQFTRAFLSSAFAGGFEGFAIEF